MKLKPVVLERNRKKGAKGANVLRFEVPAL